MEFNEVKDSGERREFGTGSVRDRSAGKGRFDLIPYEPLRRLAVHYENGARKYGDRNWEKGQPLSAYLDSAGRHWGKLLAGKTDEDHASALSWNAFGYVYTLERINQGTLPHDLDDLQHCDSCRGAKPYQKTAFPKTPKAGEVIAVGEVHINATTPANPAMKCYCPQCFRG